VATGKTQGWRQAQMPRHPRATSSSGAPDSIRNCGAVHSLSAVEPVNPAGGLGGDQRCEVAAPGSAVPAVTALPPSTL